METAEAVRPAPLAGCLEACARCRALITRVPPARYDEAPAGRASIGAHMRHALEHVACLVEGIDAGVVDYDARRRDPTLEQSPDAALAAIERLEDGLRALDTRGLAQPLTVRESADSESAPAETASSIGRELTFVSGHAIHHIEIAGLVAALQGIDVPADWGVAFSTAAHRGQPCG